MFCLLYQLFLLVFLYFLRCSLIIMLPFWVWYLPAVCSYLHLRIPDSFWRCSIWWQWLVLSDFSCGMRVGGCGRLHRTTLLIQWENKHSLHWSQHTSSWSLQMNTNKMLAVSRKSVFSECCPTEPSQKAPWVPSFEFLHILYLEIPWHQPRFV